MLEHAKRAGTASPLVRGCAEALPLRDHSFDRVWCINAFHHFSDGPAFVSEARRTLRPEGGLLIVGLDPHTGQDRWWIYDYFEEAIDVDKKRFPPANAIRALMTEAGFERCMTQEVQHLESALPSRAAAESGLFDKRSTSQLTALTDDECERGMHRLRRDIERANEQGSELVLTTDLTLVATIGWLS
jgi:SAM-dependent methyltransferase